MFTQKSTGRQSKLDASSSTSTPQRIEIADSLTPSVIGRGLVIVGNAYSNGQIEVSGEYQGDIKCQSLVVGTRANITGNVMADEIIVGGRVKGTIRGRHVTLQESSVIDGDIHHRSLSISDGAKFAGRSFQEEDEPAVSATSVRSATRSIGTGKNKTSNSAETAADAAA